MPASAIPTALLQISCSVIGIGINVRHVDFPAELQTIAGTVEDTAGAPVDREALLTAVLHELERGIPDLHDRAFMDEYRSRSCILGKTVTVTADDRVFDAKAIDIDNDGALIVEHDGVHKRYIYGEVRVR